jgi:hypothetical protein
MRMGNMIVGVCWIFGLKLFAIYEGNIVIILEVVWCWESVWMTKYSKLTGNLGKEGGRMANTWEIGCTDGFMLFMRSENI